MTIDVSCRATATALGSLILPLLLACSDPAHAPAPATDLSVIAIWPPAMMMRPGSTTQLQADGRTADGELRPRLAARWWSSNPAAVRVDTAGRVSAIAVGNADVFAAVGTVVGRAEVLVAQRCNFATPYRVNMPLGSQLVATATPCVPTTIHWTSSAPEIVSVSDGGLMTARQLGYAEVRAGTPSRPAEFGIVSVTVIP